MNGGFSSELIPIDRLETNAAINREHFLARMVDGLRQFVFEPRGYEVPGNIRVSCSWPSRGGMAKKRIVLGQCWDASCSDDGCFEVFVTPRIDDPVEVAAILTHEIIHIVVGLENGHRGPFPKCAKTVGLEGKMTATRGGEAFKRAIEPLLESLGPYPHSALNRLPDAGAEPRTSGPKPQKGRMRKAECGSCGLTLRVAPKWLEAAQLACPDMSCRGHNRLMTVS